MEVFNINFCCFITILEQVDHVFPPIPSLLHN